MIHLLATATEAVKAIEPPLRSAPQGGPPTLVVLVATIAYVFIFTLIIISLIRLVKYLSSSKDEQKLMRMELGKLAEEVHLIREEIKGKKPS